MSTPPGNGCATRWTTSRPTCPTGLSGPSVNSDFGDVAVATIAMTAEGFSYREIKDAADNFRKRLYRLAGIAKVELLGAQDERVWLEVDTSKLASVGVQVNALIRDLRARTSSCPPEASMRTACASCWKRLGISRRAGHRDDADEGRDDRQPGAARRPRDGPAGLRVAQGQTGLFQRAARGRPQHRHAA